MNPDELPSFNPLLYPRSYKPSTGYLLFLGSASCLCAAGGIAGMLYFGTGHEIKSSREEFILVGLSALFLLLGIFLMGSVLTSRLILTADSIELKYLVSSKLFRRSDVAGFRILPTQYIPTLVLQPSPPSRKNSKSRCISGPTRRSRIGSSTFQIWIAKISRNPKPSSKPPPLRLTAPAWRRVKRVSAKREASSKS